MTTALIGKQGAFAVKARVALVSKSGMGGLASSLVRSGHEAIEFADWGALAVSLAATTVDLILCDSELSAEMPRGFPMPALQVSDESAAKSGSSLGSISATALEGASEALLALAVLLSAGILRTRELEFLLDGVRAGSALVGRSPVMRRLQSVLSRAADTDATVLIEGPAGSGKSLAARIIHCKSRRGDRALVVIDCATSDAETLQKALESARATTLLLPHIDRLPASAQAVLVRHLKERTTSQRGGAPRLIATTPMHLPELVARGTFREDLYYRLHGFPLVMPSLREHPEDIFEIAESMLDGGLHPTGRASQGFTPAARALLESMPWPGNVAQLEATVRRAQVLASGAPIDREHLMVQAPHALPSAASAALAASTPRTESLDEALDEDSIRPFEEEEQLVLSRALRATKGNVRRAAQLLGIGRATLYRKIQQYRLRLQ